MFGTRVQKLAALGFSVVLALAVLVVLFWMAGSAGASPPAQGPETPLLINYQGYLTDDSGQPITATLNMTFTLWSQASGGSELWQEASKPVSVTNGLFNTVLGSQEALSTDVFTSTELWLGVQVGGDAEMTPRQRLVSAPYAVGARDADTLDGLHASDLGDITAVNAGTGLTGGGASGEVTVTLDTTYTDGRYWSLTGNGGTTPGTNFLGTTDNVSLTLAVSGTAALRLEPNATSPNVIGGYKDNSVTAGAYGATIGGGGASGVANQVTANYGTVGGGQNNTANQIYATVGGGGQNIASGNRATVGGGGLNTAQGGWATVGGGYHNTASDYATVGGGYLNTASKIYATVGGGSGNTASGDYATVCGGGRSNPSDSGSANRVTDDYGTVGGGGNNQAGNNAGPTTDAQYATVGGGIANTASGTLATVPGGENNAAQGDFSFAAGRRAKANHQGAFVWADSTDADINSPANDTFIVRANGGFWFITATTSFTPTVTAGEFISTSTGGYLSTGGAWTDGSDRNAKENFRPVDGQEVLARLAEMPITTWNYKAEDPSIRHIGPVAQDFYATFGLGRDDTHIASLDSSGVALAAIQELYQRNQELAAENAALQAENVTQQEQIDDLEARLAALEALMRKEKQ